MQEGLRPDFPPYPELVETIKKSLHEQTEKSGRPGRLQFYFLIAGALFYIFWHVLEMYERTKLVPILL